MIANSSLKVAIIQKYNNLNNIYTLEEILATEIIFYKYILSFIQSNPEQKNNINELVSSYSDEFKTKFIYLKNAATSYQNIIIFLKKIKATSLLTIKEYDIDQVYTLYINGKQIVTFDPFYFDELMYNADNISDKEVEFLNKVHFSIMYPIYDYFHTVYGIDKSDIKIISSTEVQGNAGKIIRFKIQGLDIANAYAAIVNKHIPIYNYKCELEYPNIKLTIL